MLCENLKQKIVFFPAMSRLQPHVQATRTTKKIETIYRSEFLFITCLQHCTM